MLRRTLGSRYTGFVCHSLIAGAHVVHCVAGGNVHPWDWVSAGAYCCLVVADSLRTWGGSRHTEDAPTTAHE